MKAALETCKGKFKLFGELPAYAGFYFKEEIEYDPAAAQKDFTAENKPRLARLREALAKLEPFEADPIGNTLKAVAQELGVKTGRAGASDAPGLLRQHRRAEPVPFAGHPRQGARPAAD